MEMPSAKTVAPITIERVWISRNRGITVIPYRVEERLSGKIVQYINNAGLFSKYPPYQAFDIRLLLRLFYLRIEWEHSSVREGACLHNECHGDHR